MEKARVVKSLAGHDQGSLMAVLDEKDGFLLLADGKHRRLSKPKRKNSRHTAEMPYQLVNEELLSDRTLRRALMRCKEKEDSR